MATTIENNGASIKITEDGVSRYILKYQIREVEIVRDTIIKIDIGQGALNNIFVDQANVTAPASASVEALRDLIMGMLQSNVAGTATEAKQTEEIGEIKNLQAVVGNLQAKINSLDDKTFYQPSLVDESNPNAVYNGFALPGAKVDAPVWAIQKVTKVKGVLTYQWAAGTKTFDKIWNNRTALIYS
ncbi:MAG: hypothetical protein PSX36_10530 [bacterium]|nr:hypothetical protein [bacterium]